ncbi:MAG: TRAP transporter small permease [Dehalococcoidales bacterium]|jgi:TRAP-type C4-dicarboxylate transport system permease small subunit|nr:TRAP transporter small permease [Dehalococcoidales bacterium]
MSKIVTWAERFLSPPIKIIHIIGYCVLFVLIFLTVADITGRKLAGVVSFMNPVPGTFELTEYALIVIVFASIGYTQLRGEHISIDVVTSHFPKRVQAILDCIMYLASIAMFALVAWQSFVYAGRLQAGNNVSAVLKIPQYPFAIIVAVGSIIYCLAVLFSFLVSLARAIKPVTAETGAEGVKDVP